MRKPLTCRQQEVLRYVRRYIERNGYPPSCKDIGTAFGFTKKRAYDYLTVLQRKGYIRRTAQRVRGLRLVESNRRVYRLKAPMPAYGLEKGDCVVVLHGAKPTSEKCVLREGDTVVGVVIGVTRKI